MQQTPQQLISCTCKTQCPTKSLPADQNKYMDKENQVDDMNFKVSNEC